MTTDIQQHKLAYLGLALMITGFVSSFLIFWPNRIALRIIIVTFMSGYFFWGILVHKKAGHINSEIIKEYGLVALVGGVVLLMLTN